MRMMHLTPRFLILVFFMTVFVHTNETRRDDSSDSNASCEHEWDEFGDHCYKLEGIMYDYRLSWRGATARCSEIGGSLASIHSKEENEFLTSSYLEKKNTIIWIAFHATDGSSIYKWDDESPTDFENWAINEPNPLRKSDLYCVTLSGMRILSAPGEWVEWPCSAFLGFICKKKIQRPNVTEWPVTIQVEEKFSTISLDETTPDYQDEITTLTYMHTNEMPKDDSSDFGTPCEKEWIQFGEHCYKLEGLTIKRELTWRASASRCSELGGHLASIHSKEENEFLAALVEMYDVSFCWIGMYSIGNSSIYEWDDGSPTDFKNWFRYAPIVLKENDLYCGALTDGYYIGEFGEWIELDCCSKQAFICKKKIKVTSSGYQHENTSSNNANSNQDISPGYEEGNATSSNTIQIGNDSSNTKPFTIEHVEEKSPANSNQDTSPEYEEENATSSNTIQSGNDSGSTKPFTIEHVEEKIPAISIAITSPGKQEEITVSSNKSPKINAALLGVYLYMLLLFILFR